jgi:hypothetical protein
MAGTVTGRDANLHICTHDGGSAPSFTYGHSDYGVGDFSLTLDRGTVEQDLIGMPGNYFDQGSLSLEGSITAAKFATSGIADFLDNIVDTGYTTAATEYLAISGCVSDDTSYTYLSWYLTSCQVTGYDVSIGDADTITEASIDFVHMLPQNISYVGGCIRDA